MQHCLAGIEAMACLIKLGLMAVEQTEVAQKLPFPATMAQFAGDAQRCLEVIPRLGKLTAGAAEPYQYLVESIRKFPKQEAFAQLIRDAGFSQVTYRNLTGGIAAIHSGWKI